MGRHSHALYIVGDTLETIEQFEKSLIAFLNHDEKNILVIKGPWGVGKTHFWNNFITNINNIKQDKYSYISLFGVDKLSEVQSLIFYNSDKIQSKKHLKASKQT